MPMYTTPTTQHVLAGESTPAIFRPGNQANLVPALPTNIAPSMSMMPGMGEVRSGSPISNGLSPDDLEFENQMRKASLKRAVGMLGQQHRQLALAGIEADSALQRAKERGDSSGIAAATRKVAAVQGRVASLKAQTLMARNAQAELSKPFWERKTKFPAAYSPATPRADALAPAGISYQKGMRKLLAMQANIQPVAQMVEPAGMSGMPAWFSEQLISGVPNWVLAASGGGLLLLLIRKK